MSYIMGNSDAERRRLGIQARLLDPHTLRLLHDAGAAEGKTVLDVGTGAGDTARLAGELVGPSGRVLGVDIYPEMIAHARSASAGLGHVSFQTTSGSLEEIDARFDIVLVRLVLQFVDDQERFLARAAWLVRPGGALIVIDAAWHVPAFWSCPAIESYDRHMDALVAAAVALGADVDVGSRLVALFANAGLAEPRLSAELVTGGKAAGIVDYNLLNGEVLFARARAAALAVPSETEQASRVHTILHDVERGDSQFFGPCLIGAVLAM